MQLTHHPAGVKRRRQALEVIRRAEVRIQLVEVLLPVPMVCGAVRRAPLDLASDGRDPHGVEPHALDVVEVVRDAGPAAATVGAIGGVARRARAAIGSREAVGEDLVDGPAAPVACRGCVGRVAERQAQCHRRDASEVHVEYKV